jgi:hypothetical protein
MQDRGTKGLTAAIRASLSKERGSQGDEGFSLCLFH